VRRGNANPKRNTFDYAKSDGDHQSNSHPDANSD
jgi:hypothetical protein